MGIQIRTFLPHLRDIRRLIYEKFNVNSKTLSVKNRKLTKKWFKTNKQI